MWHLTYFDSTVAGTAFTLSRAKMVGANAEKKIKRQLASELKKGQNENGPRAQEKVDSSEVALQEAFEAVACADVSLHPGQVESCRVGV